MLCTTVRKNEECLFMSAKGCTYKEGSCYQIVEQCEGCARITEYENAKYCTKAPEPAMKWKTGNCNLATHLVAEKSAAQKKINPIKASKRK